MGAAAAATKLTSKNSIFFAFYAASDADFAGTNCGTSATVTKQLPTGTTGIKVVEPKVGARDPSGGTRVTGVTVAGTAVTLTALADGAAVCDPEQSGVPAGQPVPWKVTYKFRAEYKRRVQPVIRVFFESYVSGAKWKRKPKVISDSRRGAPPGERFTGLRWKNFGSKKATGYGRLRQDFCRRRDNCPLNGRRIRIVATKPRYCKDSDKIEYLKLTTFVGRREWSGLLLQCG